MSFFSKCCFPGIYFVSGIFFLASHYACHRRGGNLPVNAFDQECRPKAATGVSQDYIEFCVPKGYNESGESDVVEGCDGAGVYRWGRNVGHDGD